MLLWRHQLEMVIGAPFGTENPTKLPAERNEGLWKGIASANTSAKAHASAQFANSAKPVKKRNTAPAGWPTFGKQARSCTAPLTQ